MERTERPAINGSPVEEEPFWVIEPSTGKKRRIREMTDAELERNFAHRTKDLSRAQQGMQQAFNALVDAHRMHAVLEYEKSRRKHSLATLS